MILRSKKPTSTLGVQVFGRQHGNAPESKKTCHCTIDIFVRLRLTRKCQQIRQRHLCCRSRLCHLALENRECTNGQRAHGECMKQTIHLDGDGRHRPSPRAEMARQNHDNCQRMSGRRRQRENATHAEFRNERVAIFASSEISEKPLHRILRHIPHPRSVKDRWAKGKGTKEDWEGASWHIMAHHGGRAGQKQPIFKNQRENIRSSHTHTHTHTPTHHPHPPPPTHPSSKMLQIPCKMGGPSSKTLQKKQILASKSGKYRAK